ncbi:hypothetical protein [Flavobacterium sp.]|uniref:hypothetical protein n=1 Tax=Flavobacterium sp. TaxID=239 RepID=UPI002FDAEC4E
MKVAKLYITIISLLFMGSLSMLAQIDGTSKPKPSGSSFGITPSTSGTSIITPKPKPETERSSAPLREEKTIDMTKNYGFVKPKFDVKPNLSTGTETEMKEEYKRGKYFGDFRSKTKFIKIMCRDHEAVDGDKIRIIINDKIIENSVFLNNGFSIFYYELAPGFNNIEFLALNQGESGPNTAEFAIQDEFGNTIMSNIWNLATGAKASLIIVKE